MEKTLTKPTVNLNGTNGHDLAMQYQTAHAAVGDAIKAMQQAMPHGRDYQTAGLNAFQLARDEHWDRMRALQAVEVELAEIWEDITRQNDERARRMAR